MLILYQPQIIISSSFLIKFLFLFKNTFLTSCIEMVLPLWRTYAPLNPVPKNSEMRHRKIHDAYRIDHPRKKDSSPQIWGYLV